MRICWLSLNSSHSHASLALPLLHLACERAGSAAEWSVVTATTAEAPGPVALRIAEQAPDVLAATAWLFNSDLLLKIVRRVKALRPACRIILGGPEFLGRNESFLRREPAVDAVVRGEAESVFPQWLARWDAPESWADLPGLCRLDAAGAYRDNGRAVVEAAAFAALPPPAASRFFDATKPFVLLETSRGCLNRCGFCTSAGDAPVRWSTSGQVREQLQRFRKLGVREVRVLDRTFNADPGRALERLDLFFTMCPETRFHLELHPAFLPASLRAALAAAPAGRLHVEAGLQSTDPVVLEACGRLGDPAAAWDGLAFLCGLRNLEVHVDLLAGLPGLRLAQLWEDLRRLTRLGPAEIQLETLKLLPGTVLRGESGRLGLVFAPDPPYEVLRTPQMDAAELSLARRLSRVVDGFYNAPAWRPAVRRAVAASADFYPEFVEWLRDRLDVDQPSGLERRGFLLHEFLTPRLPAAAACVEVDWLRHGLPPAHCPGEGARPWKAPLPAAAVWCGAAATPPSGPEASRLRVWVLGPDAARWWFGYDRSVDATHPVAVWHEGGPPPAAGDA